MADSLQVTDSMSLKKQNDTLALRQPKTGEWLLGSDQFRRFKAEPSQTLFCPGISGAGKTVLTSVVVEHLVKTICNVNRNLMAYVYCSFEWQGDQTAELLLQVLLKQLIQSCSDVPEAVRSMFRNQLQKEKRQPSLDEALWAAQQIAVGSKVFIVVDALDELRASEARRFLGKIFELQRSSDVRLFATSRFIPEIQKMFGRAQQLPIRADRGDIARFVEGNMGHVSSFLEQQTPQLKAEVVDTICNASDGM